MVYNVREAAQRLGVTVQCVYKWIENGVFIGPHFNQHKHIEGKILNKMGKGFKKNTVYSGVEAQK